MNLSVTHVCHSPNTVLESSYTTQKITKPHNTTAAQNDTKGLKRIVPQFPFSHKKSTKRQDLYRVAEVHLSYSVRPRAIALLVLLHPNVAERLLCLPPASTPGASAMWKAASDLSQNLSLIAKRVFMRQNAPIHTFSVFAAFDSQVMLAETFIDYASSVPRATLVSAPHQLLETAAHSQYEQGSA